jgi:hypothetical protein
MITKRNMLLTGVAFAGMGMGGTSTCTSQIDPQKVIDLIKTGCGIAVTAATIAQIIGLDPTMSISAIVSLICTGFQTAKAAGKLGAEPAKGTTVHFVVYVDGKPVDVTATVQ